MKSSVLFSLATLAAFAAPTAWAYIPPSQFIVNTITKKHSGFKGMRVRSEVTALENDKPIGLRFTEVTLFNPKEGVMRLKALDEAGKELYVVERKIGALPPAAAILFENRPVELANLLKDSGIPVRTEADLLKLKDEAERRASETEFLARVPANGLAWVIGTKEGGSQLWVEKDTFLPIRFLTKSSTEVRYERYRFFREFPYPRMITLMSSGKGLLQDEVVEVAVNTDSPEWKIPLTQTGFTDAGNALPSAMRDLIQKYYETVR